MQTQSTASARTVTSKTGMILPACITPQTDLNIGLTAMATYYRLSGCKCSWGTAMQVTQAMQDGGAVIVEYIALDGEMTARCLWPLAISLSKDNNIVARC